MKTVNTTKAPMPVGPYSQAVIAQNLVFCSGQIGIDPKTNKLVDGFNKQVRQIFENIKKILQVSGSGINQIVKVTVYLTNSGDFETFNKIYENYIKHKPARTTVFVEKLPKKALLEVEVIAINVT
ncbi:MAG: RutC family protein [Patescibacteria group bacterium]|nr:MAG: RutC family protein [Patescibacteria group bacterium]GIW63167.1 MAG: RutC family protein [Patescibacteria group bacterium]